jgi:hypothetical protein
MKPYRTNAMETGSHLYKMNVYVLEWMESKRKDQESLKAAFAEYVEWRSAHNNKPDFDAEDECAQQFGRYVRIIASGLMTYSGKHVKNLLADEPEPVYWCDL